MKVCIECNNDFEPESNKAIYCSDSCRQKAYRKRVAAILKMVKENNKVENKKRIEGERNAPPTTNKVIYKYPSESINNLDIKTQIKAIESEKIPEHRNTRIGRASWELERQQRISELRKLLEKSIF